MDKGTLGWSRLLKAGRIESVDPTSVSPDVDAVSDADDEDIADEMVKEFVFRRRVR